MYRDSLYWVAPEILPNQDTKPSGPAVDIWALGITMIELAIGSPPLASMDLNPTQILQTIAEGSAPSLSAEQKAKFSKAFLDIIDLCLVKNPAKRFGPFEFCLLFIVFQPFF
jgi:serine/threonine-protein kinase OSR1/STK39